MYDLIQTAQQAVQRGIIPRGYGYWHRPKIGSDFLQFYVAFGGRLYDSKAQKLVITKRALFDWFSFQRRCVLTGITQESFIGTEWRIWHDVVSHDKVLFWNGTHGITPIGRKTIFVMQGGGLFFEEKCGSCPHPCRNLRASWKYIIASPCLYGHF